MFFGAGGLNGMQHMCFGVQHPQNRVGGAGIDQPDLDNTDLGPKLVFFGHFLGEKWCFLVLVALKQL